MKIHRTYINRCIALAKNGLPSSMPNPSVGAVLVANERIIGEGYTSAYGGPHAEVNAIAFAKTHSPELLSQSTLYVSLEPCSHFGKTPPCANLIVESGIKKVVIGTVDPFAKVAGKGIEILENHGIEVIVGVLSDACRAVNVRFFTFHVKKRPFILLKWAQTPDLFIAPKEKSTRAPVWITNQRSRQLVHKWRSEEQAILVGANTVLADNPNLTTRDWKGKNPIRLLIDEGFKIPKDVALFNDDAKTIVLPSKNPQDICQLLFNQGIQSVIVEGGAKTLQSFINAGLWDEARVFTGNKRFIEGIKAPLLTKEFLFVEEITILTDRLTIYKNKTS